MIWQLVQNHLRLIIQTLLPFGFLIVDSLLKWLVVGTDVGGTISEGTWKIS
ncbi:MAG: hypothetical protein ICV87_05410 [Gemmatimonadetes bacterium]|nr:hypothetical protein [Gemmatimonadota bacterium]